MQNFVQIPSTKTLSDSLSDILNNDMTSLSCSSGTAFPTTNLQLGMPCYRTDEKKLYRLTTVSPSSVWTLEIDFSSGAGIASVGFVPVNKAGDTMSGALQISTAGTTLLLNSTNGNTYKIALYDNSTLVSSIGGSANSPLVVANSSGTTVLSSDSSGNFVATANVSAYSDERLKTDWLEVVDLVTKLAAVKAGIYTRVDTGQRQVGVSAQSLLSVMPDAVMKAESGLLSVAYGNAALLAAVELAKVVVELRQRLEVLESAQ